MAGQIEFIVNAEEGKAVAAFMRIFEAQKKVEGGLGEIHGRAKETESGFEKLSDKVGDVASEALSMVTAFASLEGVKEIIKSVMEELEHAREELREFHEAGSASTMPRYINDIAGYNKRSLQLSDSFGVDVKSVIEPLRSEVAEENPKDTNQQVFAKEESALHYHALDPSIDPKDVAKAEHNLMTGYGMDLQHAEGNVRWLQENGNLKPADQVALGQQLDLGFQSRGIGVDDRNAFMAMIAESGGKESSVGKGLLALQFDQDKLAKKGIVSQKGDIFSEMQQIQDYIGKNGSAGVEDQVGMRIGPALNYFIKHQDEFRQLKSSAQKAPANLLEQRVERAESQTAYGDAEAAARSNQQKINRPLEDAGEQKAASTADNVDLSASHNLPYGLQWTRHTSILPVLESKNSNDALSGQYYAAPTTQNPDTGEIQSRVLQPLRQGQAGFNDANQELELYLEKHPQLQAQLTQARAWATKKARAEGWTTDGKVTESGIQEMLKDYKGPGADAARTLEDVRGDLNFSLRNVGVTPNYDTDAQRTRQAVSQLGGGSSDQAGGESSQALDAAAKAHQDAAGNLNKAADNLNKAATALANAKPGSTPQRRNNNLSD